MLPPKRDIIKSFLLTALPWLIFAILSKLILRYATDLSHTLPLSHYVFNPTAGLNIAERARNGWEITPLAWAAQSLFIFSIAMFAVDLVRMMHNIKIIALWRYLIPAIMSAMIITSAMVSTLSFEKYSYERLQISANNASYLSQNPDANIPRLSPEPPAGKKEIDVQIMEMRIWDTLYYYGPDFFYVITFCIILLMCRPWEWIILGQQQSLQNQKGFFKKLKQLGIFVIILYVFDLFYNGVQSVIKDTAFILSNYGAAALWSFLYTIKWMFIILIFFWIRYESPKDQMIQHSEPN